MILIIVLAVTLSGSDDPIKIDAVSFSDAITGKLYPKSKSLSWISSNSIILRGQDLVEETVDTKVDTVSAAWLGLICECIKV